MFINLLLKLDDVYMFYDHDLNLDNALIIDPLNMVALPQCISFYSSLTDITFQEEASWG